MEANLKCVETLERQVKENQPELAMMTAQILKSGGKFSTDVVDQVMTRLVPNTRKD